MNFDLEFDNGPSLLESIEDVADNIDANAPTPTPVKKARRRARNRLNSSRVKEILFNDEDGVRPRRSGGSSPDEDKENDAISSPANVEPQTPTAPPTTIRTRSHAKTLQPVSINTQPTVTQIPDPVDAIAAKKAEIHAQLERERETKKWLQETIEKNISKLIDDQAEKDRQWGQLAVVVYGLQQQLDALTVEVTKMKDAVAEAQRVVIVQPADKIGAPTLVVTSERQTAVGPQKAVPSIEVPSAKPIDATPIANPIAAPVAAPIATLELPKPASESAGTKTIALPQSLTDIDEEPISKPVTARVVKNVPSTQISTGRSLRWPLVSAAAIVAVSMLAVSTNACPLDGESDLSRTFCGGYNDLRFTLNDIAAQVFRAINTIME